MLRLLSNEWRAVLAPAQVSLSRPGRWWVGGERRGRADPQVAPCDLPAPGQPAWSAALGVLEQMLARLRVRRGTAQVILSNRFVRYAVLDWHDGIDGADEEAAYARLCFRERFGAAADDWDIRVDGSAGGQCRVASAVDARLLAALRASSARAGMRLRSVQPQLMTVFNQFRARVDAERGWLVLAESGCLCVALFAERQWRAVRAVRIAPGWQDGLGSLLDRETLLADPGADVTHAFLWAPELAADVSPDCGRWQLRRLATQDQ